MSEKKRKRTSEKGDRPAKKVALHASETVKVQLLEDDDVLGPVIGM
jgi:DNA-directed RNA polymerase I subunit RPA49